MKSLNRRNIVTKNVNNATVPHVKKKNKRGKRKTKLLGCHSACKDFLSAPSKEKDSDRKLGIAISTPELPVNSKSLSKPVSLRSSEAEINWDSYPSDSDEETGDKISSVKKPAINIYSDEDSSSTGSVDESIHSELDVESYPSDTEDEDERKKGLPVNSTPSIELQEREKRTVFVGNLPYTVERNQLKKWFSKFGKVECVRLRSAPIADPEVPRKVAVIKKTFHENRSNIHAYVRFKSIEAADNAIQGNGALFNNHVIRVDHSIPDRKYDAGKAVFIGNVPFAIEEDNLRSFFAECGDIESVRIIRDKNTGVGKGFAYINFKCSSSVPLALALDGEVLEKRELRVKPIKYQKKNAKSLHLKPQPQHNKSFTKKKPKSNFKTNKANKFQGETSERKEKKIPWKKSAEQKKREVFSQILANTNKKHKKI